MSYTDVISVECGISSSNAAGLLAMLLLFKSVGKDVDDDVLLLLLLSTVSAVLDVDAAAADTGTVLFNDIITAPEDDDVTAALEDDDVTTTSGDGGLSRFLGRERMVLRQKRSSFLLSSIPG